jgi:hypothetical protein
VLEQLYAPPGRNLGDSKGTLGKLQFAVRRIVNLDKWIEPRIVSWIFGWKANSDFAVRFVRKQRSTY